MKSRLAEFQIQGLFGLYDHRIRLNLKERITIIIGPNGRGKTVCLKFIEALFRKKYSYFAEIPFRKAEFFFTSGETIRLDWSDSETTGGDSPSLRALRFTLVGANGTTETWMPPAIDARLLRDLRRHIPPQWEQISPDVWMDQTDGEEVSYSELVERYRLPPKLASALQQEVPDSFASLVGGIDCHLIETQRLLVLPQGSADEEVEFDGYVQRRRRLRGSRLAIQQKADKLKSILQETLTRYANLSQSLDRSFPLRVFEAQGSGNLSQEQLRRELRQLDQRRDALMSAGILDTEYQAVTMHGGHIEPGVAMALEIYVKDTVQKLDLFNNLRARLDLFKELIERRFIDKTIRIDRGDGFQIVSKTGSAVPLDKLSSGEQHQLILVFDLLFEVTEDSLIMIDEPELSLHVAWQKRIIESLTRIIELNGFDVLLATHSPAVVARHFNLTVELGPVDESDT
jgi:energy-coupling factor transporter ATP-binding protein EcfA2